MDRLLERFCSAYDDVLQKWDDENGSLERMYLCGMADAHRAFTGKYTLSNLATELIIRHSAQFLASVAK